MYAYNTKNFWKSFFLRFRNFINSTYTFSKLDIKVFKKWFILLKKNKNIAFSNLTEIEYILIIYITLIKYKTQSGFTLKITCHFFIYSCKSQIHYKNTITRFFIDICVIPCLKSVYTCRTGLNYMYSVTTLKKMIIQLV